MTRRLFVAAWPDAEWRAELAGVLASLRETGAPLRWVPPENLHVTLQFLGDVEAERVPELVEVVQGALAGKAAFRVCVAGLGSFPAHGPPRVVWAGLAAGGPELAALASALERALIPGGFLVGSDRPFRAHVTLGRSKGSRGLERLMARLVKGTPAGRTHSLAEVRLVESRLESRGAVYAPVARFPLPASS